MADTERERLVEDLLRESLYSSGDAYEQVVAGVEEEGGTVRVRLHGEPHDFDLVFTPGASRSSLVAQLERKLHVALHGPDLSRPPIQG